MSNFRCKQCTAQLNFIEGATTVECEHCGTMQTLPRYGDENKNRALLRANDLRFHQEFDKAAGLYQSIVAEWPDEPEAYWGLCLCKYGIEYVDDPRTNTKIPTCHRTLTTSIMDDSDFELTLENADITQKEIYRNYAKEIDRVQRKILEIASNAEKYDIFICYKETDDVTKKRTVDSELAQDIYTTLLKEGYKVFFARDTLKSVAGTEYEPYIYAALTSAKVMLAIGTKDDYYDAVWVKNEWNRYIVMMQNDSSKTLIPCYKDLDPYYLPKELRNLQALDMADISFSLNLLNNIKKRIPREEAKPIATRVQADTITGNVTVDSLFERAYIFLKDGDFNKANEYFEKVLDRSPKEAKAYWGKLLCSQKCIDNAELTGNKRISELYKYAVNKDILETSDDYVKQRILELWGTPFKNAVEYASNDDKQIYISYFNTVFAEVTKQLYEEQEKTRIRISSYLESGYSFLEKGDFDKANEYFEMYLAHSPTAAKAYWGKLLSSKKCRNNEELIGNVQIAKIYKYAVWKNVFETSEYDIIQKIYEYWGSLFKKAVEYAQNEEKQIYLSCFNTVLSATTKQLRDEQNNANKKTEADYNNAVNRFSIAKSSAECTDLKIIFESLGDYKDSKSYASLCEEQAKKFSKKEEFKEGVADVAGSVLEGAKYIFIYKGLGGFLKWSFLFGFICSGMTMYGGVNFLTVIGTIALSAVSMALYILGSWLWNEGDEDVKELTIKSKLFWLICVAWLMFVIIGCFNGYQRDVNTSKVNAQIEAMGSPKIGDIVKFGYYEQDNNENNGDEPVEWIVINKEGDKYLLLSRYCLTAIEPSEYSRGIEAINSVMYSLQDSLFNDIHLEYIVEVTNYTKPNPIYADEDDETTDDTDRIFFLSIEEYEYYRNINGVSRCLPTPYASELWNAPDEVYWWLRTPGEESNYYITYVDKNGNINYEGAQKNAYCYWRPAVWIDLGKNS